MKTLNKILKRLLMIVIAFLFCIGTFAQKSFHNNDFKSLTASVFKSTEEIIFAMRSSAEKKAFVEEEITLEDWMSDLESWMKKLDTTSQESSNINTSAEAESEMEMMEESLELEDWMLDIHWIEKENFDEEELSIEAWMQNPKNWEVNN